MEPDGHQSQEGAVNSQNTDGPDVVSHVFCSSALAFSHAVTYFTFETAR